MSWAEEKTIEKFLTKTIPETKTRIVEKKTASTNEIQNGVTTLKDSVTSQIPATVQNLVAGQTVQAGSYRFPPYTGASSGYLWQQKDISVTGRGIAYVEYSGVSYKKPSTSNPSILIPAVIIDGVDTGVFDDLAGGGIFNVQMIGPLAFNHSLYLRAGLSSYTNQYAYMSYVIFYF